MTHKIIRLLVCLIIVLRLFISSALAVIPVHANPFAIGVGIGIEALGWGAVASASGAKLNYSKADLMPFGEIDIYGNFKFTDLAGAQVKIQNDYAVLGEQTKNSFLNALNANMTRYQEAEAQLQSGSITQEQYNNIISEYHGFQDITNALSTWIGQNTACMSVEELSKLELSCAQIKLFADFLKSNASAIQNGSISVQKGIQLIAGDLYTIKFPRDVTMYCTPVVSKPYEIVKGKLGYYTFTFNFDSSHNLHRLAYDITSGQLVWEGLSGNIYYSHDYLYYQYAQNDLWISCGTRGSYPFFPLSTTEFILSPSIPLIDVDTGTVALPEADTIPVTTTKDITTTFPIDTPMDTPVSIPMPDVDTMIRDLTTTGDISIPIDSDIPITIPKIGDIDTSLPDLSIPVSITNKFPFCLPFDFYRGVKVLVADPEAPKIDMYVGTELWGRKIGGQLVIDFEPFSPVAKLFRWLSTLAFTFMLIFSTKKLMGGGS